MADSPRTGTSSESEKDAIRSSNDRDQAAERSGVESEHNRGYDEAVRGGSSGVPEFEGGSPEFEEDTDPDSAESDNDRDDMLKE